MSNLSLMGLIFTITNRINRMTKKGEDMHRFSGNAYGVLYISLKMIEITFFLIISGLNSIGIHFYSRPKSRQDDFLRF